MKKIAVILTVALMLSLCTGFFAMSASAAAGDNILLASAGVQIIDKCGATALNPAEDCIDGNTSKSSANGNKWCCVPDRADENFKYTTHPQPVAADYPHFIVFDMGSSKSFDKYHIDNAGLYENKAYDTAEWSMLVSDDNKTWAQVDSVTGNTEDTYDKTFDKPIKARYIKFIIPVAEQTPVPAPVGTVRIYAIAVYESATAGTLPGGGTVAAPAAPATTAAGGAAPATTKAPAAPAQSTTKAGATGAAKTGDATTTYILLAAALLGSAVVIVRIRKA